MGKPALQLESTARRRPRKRRRLCKRCAASARKRNYRDSSLATFAVRSWLQIPEMSILAASGKIALGEQGTRSRPTRPPLQLNFLARAKKRFFRNADSRGAGPNREEV